MNGDDPSTDGDDNIAVTRDVEDALTALPSAKVDDADDGGIPTFVDGNLGQMPQGLGPSADVIRPSMAKLSKVFRADPNELTLARVDESEDGDQHFRFSQRKNGLDVIGGELIVHVRQGTIIAANGAARADLAAPAAAKLDAGAAVTAAKAASAHVDGLTTEESPKLAYLPAGSKMNLVYVVRVTGQGKDGSPVVDDVLVNAIDGSIERRIPHIYTAEYREVHTSAHSQNLPGKLVRKEGQAAVTDSVVNANYAQLGLTYSCYKTLFNRDSYDGKGAHMISSVHFDRQYDNAFWDGTQMVYGDGDGQLMSNLARSLDVTAHELTHAVTESTSNLIYDGESGGLNEAMSDIHSVACVWLRDGKKVNAGTYLLGDDIWTPGTPGDALRYMNDPAKDGGSLDHYSEYNSSVDVHYSSGIANLAFYLLAQGGKHPRHKSNVTVTGIGLEKASKIFYRANTSILTSNANFKAARVATEQAAKQLGYTTAEIASVSAAWQAVGVTKK